MSIANASEAVGDAAQMGAGSSLMSLLPMVLIFAIFYFFLIRPQVKKQKALDNMIGNLKKGDKVVAAGGIYGVVNKIEDNVLYLEIAENVKIKLAKSAVTEVLSSDAKAQVEAAPKKESAKKAKK